MSDLIKYNGNFVPHAFGLANLGNSCFFNALMQSLLCCSSIWEVLKTREEKNVEKSEFETLLLNFYNISITNKDTTSTVEPIYDYVINNISKYKGIDIKSGKQSDANELFTHMFYMFESLIPNLYRLFIGFNTNILKCKYDTIQESFSEGTIVKVKHLQYNIKYESWSSILFSVERNCECRVDANVNIKLCKSNGTQIITNYNSPDYQNTLYEKDKITFTRHDVKPIYIPEVFSKHTGAKNIRTKCPCINMPEMIDIIDKNEDYDLEQDSFTTMIPEILCFTLGKYKCKNKIICPHTLYILASKTTQYVYRHVAHCQHNGGADGGHYWAYGLRSDDKWYRLDDTHSRISIGDEHIPDAETYMVFYHYYETIKIINI